MTYKEGTIVCGSWTANYIQDTEHICPHVQGMNYREYQPTKFPDVARESTASTTPPW